MNNPNETTYDQLPYKGAPYEGSHPDRLATIATLFGLEPGDAEQARVLELGCTDGGNIIPMALALPQASFVGVDLSNRQISDGLELVESLGLTNISLQHRNILDVSEADGLFDYIICHGVYSWVPPDVQDHILTICSKNLKPNGVAYVSYNTYPGWFMRGMVREMMRFHAAQFTTPAEQVQQARAMLDFLIDATPSGDDSYHILLRRELEHIRNRKDTYIYHEHLEQVNEPLFFWKFAERAKAHGLRYLGESHFSQMALHNFAPEVAATLEQLATDIIHMEQYMDFVRNRQFRQTLLCHEAAVPNRQVEPDRIMKMHVSSQLQPAEDSADLTLYGEVEFRNELGAKVTVSDPATKRALARLGSIWPETFPVQALPELAQNSELIVCAADQYEAETEAMTQLILELYVSDLVELRTSPQRAVSTVSERPLCQQLTRIEAEAGRLATNQKHELVELTPLDCLVLRQLDGKRDLDDICAIVEASIQKGDLVVAHKGQRLSGNEVSKDFVMQIVQQSLRTAAANALLISHDPR